MKGEDYGEARISGLCNRKERRFASMFDAILYALNAFFSIRRERRWINQALRYHARNAKPVFRGRWE